MKRVLIWALLLANVAVAEDLNDGIEAFKKQDFSKAFSVFMQECNEKNMEGCVRAGTLYVQGRGVKQDYAKALDLYTQACTNKNYSGCWFGLHHTWATKHNTFWW